MTGRMTKNPKFTINGPAALTAWTVEKGEVLVGPQTHSTERQKNNCMSGRAITQDLPRYRTGTVSGRKDRVKSIANRFSCWEETRMLVAGTAPRRFD